MPCRGLPGVGQKYGHAERRLGHSASRPESLGQEHKDLHPKHPDFPYIIKMDVGRWPTES
jgi:hypothetical protein